MMSGSQAIVLAAALLVQGGSAGATETVSFAKDVVPVLRSHCATCHLTGQEAGNMKLHPAAAWASLVKVASIESPLRRVEPGAPGKSYLMHKLDGTHLDAGGQGVQMPFGAPPLEPEVRERIRSWIAAGAPNN